MSPTVSRGFLQITLNADKLPLETDPIVRDNNAIGTLKRGHQTFVVPYSTDNRSIFRVNEFFVEMCVPQWFNPAPEVLIHCL